MARDKIHDAVRNALEKDGWIVPDDPVKAFNQPSLIYEFHRALGQYFNGIINLLGQRI